MNFERRRDSVKEGLKCLVLGLFWLHSGSVKRKLTCTCGSRSVAMDGGFKGSRL